MSFTIRASQYNILAANLASNLRPWYFYGYKGLNADGTYCGDQFDPSRAAAFGTGRSPVFIEAWCAAKEYWKLFDTDGYDYAVHRPELYQGAEGPSFALRGHLARAIFDFLRRNDTNHMRGDRKLAYNLFDRRLPEFSAISAAILNPLGYVLTEDEWQQLEVAKRAVREQPAGTPERTSAIDAFNEVLAKMLVQKRRALRVPASPTHHDFRLTEDRMEKELHDVALEWATQLCLSDEDMCRLLEHQQQLEWSVRSEQLVREILGMRPDVVGLEEVDKVEDLAQKLSPKLRLGAFKHRKTLPYDDGVALFYDPSVFGLERGADGGPRVAAIRYSASAELRNHPLKLRRLRLPYRDGVIGAEELHLGSLNGAGLSPEGSVDLWAFTEELCVRRQEGFDERVAVAALLKHQASGQTVIAVCTHLAHSQNRAHPEAVRAVQVRQLTRSLDEIRKTWGPDAENAAACVLLMDANDPPRLSAYGRGDVHTPFYRGVMEEGFMDCLGEDYGATSITLNRRLRIDYIFCKEGEGWEVESSFQPALEVKLVGIDPVTGEKVLVEPSEERDRAIYGMPLPAVKDQPSCPSDHLHCSAFLTFRRRS